VEQIDLKYRAYGKGLPPRPIRLEIPGWAGDASKMENGSVPQPWHCNPFVEGSTYGIELVYPYVTECHVINDGGNVRIEWDFARERDAGVSGGEFVQFAPDHYGFNTSLDLQAPPGHVLRLEPHPRYFTDKTGTVPLAMIGNLQTEWWPKVFFVAFTAPPAGGRHIFRAGEPYAQIIVVPERASYRINPMTTEESQERLALESALSGAKHHIAGHTWRDHRGQSFNNAYKLLTRVFHTEGAEGVKQAIRDGLENLDAQLPPGMTTEQALATAREFHQAGRFAESRAICYQVLGRDPDNGGALHVLAASALSAGRPMLAVECLQKAVAAHPGSPHYLHDLGLAWLTSGRSEEALPILERAVPMLPGRADALANLAEALVLNDRANEALAIIQQALTIAPSNPVVLFRAGSVHEHAGRIEEAKSYFNRAIDLQPNFSEARSRLERLT
jgi:Flp pilus assembly protein TadD